MSGQVVMIGDIHGQLDDMVKMLDKLTPKLDESKDFNMLFLGDYVDRGIHGIEVLIFLMVLKINYPKQIIMLRGNHESRSMTTYFTFRQECIDKYDQEVYDHFMDLFDYLPLMATVNDLFLCVHGGISPDLHDLSDINSKINRFSEPPNVGMFCDLLWSDPFRES